MKVIRQLITHFEQKGRLRPEQIEDMVGRGFWAQYTPADLRSLETNVGQSFYFEVTGDPNGPIWGTDVYTSDSALGAACVHAGVLQPGETAIVRVTFVPPLPRFEGTSRNGVATQTWTNGWPGAYEIAPGRKLPEPAPAPADGDPAEVPNPADLPRKLQDLTGSPTRIC